MWEIIQNKKWMHEIFDNMIAFFHNDFDETNNLGRDKCNHLKGWYNPIIPENCDPG